MFPSPIIPNISNETDLLKVVVLGLSQSLGPAPRLKETFDAKSYESVLLNIYPTEDDITYEVNALYQALLNNGVKVLRPDLVVDCNQIFARDVAFVIDNTLFISNLIPDRVLETGAMHSILELIPKTHIEYLPEKVHTEGGDILLYNDTLLIGCYLQADYPSYKMARTNQYAIDFLRERFPNKHIIPIELHKDDYDPRRGVLHLDCAFQPIGKGKALLYREGLLNPKDVGLLEEIFGSNNLFYVTEEEAYMMNTNLISISPTKVISDKTFTRLNEHLSNAWGISVDTIPYQEVAKMGGLLRCSTLPLIRQKET